jgi:dihydroxyacetone kinase
MPMPRTITNHKRAERIEGKLSRHDPSEREWREGTELRAIEEAVRAFDAADAELHAVVRAARAANYSWASIGAVLGVSKQAAQQRFG